MKRLICLLMVAVLLVTGVSSMNVHASSLGGAVTTTEGTDFQLTSEDESNSDSESTDFVIIDNTIVEPTEPATPVDDGSQTPTIKEETTDEIKDEAIEETVEEDEFGADFGGHFDVDLPHPGSAGPDEFATFSAEAQMAPPASFDARNTGAGLPPIRDQGRWGNCWAFSAIASAEAGLRRDFSASYGSNTGNSISPYHLARFFYNTPNDLLGNITNNKTTPLPASSGAGTGYLNVGGNSLFTTWSMAAGRAGNSEAISPYGNISANNGFLPDNMAYSNFVRLQNAYWVDLTNTTRVKQMVQANGAVSMAYRDTGSYKRVNYNGRSTVTHYQSSSGQSNHAVAIVGWDNNFPAANFNTRPPGNGAWLVRNSWGSSFGDGGYFWLSYYDASITGLGKWGFVFKFEPSTNYKNLYQYDGSAGMQSQNIPAGGSVSSIFKTQGGTQRLDAVAVGVFNDNVNYSIQIFLNPQAGNPTSGTPLLSTPQTGTLPYVGYHTVKLRTPVNLPANSTFAVVITYPNGANQFVDRSYTNGGWISFTNPSPAGRTFFRNTATGSWQDFGRTNAATARIKAFTNPTSTSTPAPSTPAPTTPVTSTISAVSRNGKDIFYDINVTNIRGAGNLKGVNLAVWSERNGQDDLVWYGTGLSNGVWRGTADIRRHKDSGIYRINAVGVTSTGGRVLLGTTTFNVTAATGGRVEIANNNPNSGTFDAVVRGVSSRSSIDRVTISVWTRANKSDLRRTVAIRQSDGSFRARILTANHNFFVGTYSVQADITTGNGQMLIRNTTNLVNSKPSVAITTSSRGGRDIFYDISVTNAQVLGNIKGVNLAVWSEQNGQDDLVWYGTTSSNGVWRGAADIRRHKGFGTYRINAVGITSSGGRILLGTTTFNVTTPTGGRADIMNSNVTAGTFDVVVRGFNSRSSINRVAVAVSTGPNRTNLRWYTATRQSDGSFRVTIRATNHNSFSGTYNIQANVITGNGQQLIRNNTWNFSPRR